MSLSKWISAIVAGAILVVSVVGLCQQSPAACGADCGGSHHGSSMIHAASTGVDGCAHEATPCPTAPDHMTTFAAAYPTIPSSFVLAILIIAAFFAWNSHAHATRTDATRHTARLKYIHQKITDALAPDFLVLAFSQGILHSKIYA